MTTAARKVLGDCKVAFADWQDELNADVRRRRWVALVALLRAVGHVLYGADRKNGDPALRTAIETLWAKGDKPPIYTEFIEAERNNVLKTYSFTPTESGLEVHTRVEEVEFTDPDGRLVRVRRPWADVYERVMFVEGHFAGRGPATVVAQAIDFWERYLDDVDRDAERRRRRPTTD